MSKDQPNETPFDCGVIIPNGQHDGMDTYIIVVKLEGKDYLDVFYGTKMEHTDKAPTADLQNEAEEVSERGSEPEPLKGRDFRLDSEFRDTKTGTLLKVVYSDIGNICAGCFYMKSACAGRDWPLCSMRHRRDGKHVIFVPVEPEAEAIPTEPQQPTIGQRFYAKDGTLLETVLDFHSACPSCYYKALWVNETCPKPMACQMSTRDDKTSVCFPAVDTTKEEKST